MALEYASEELKKDREFMLAAVSKNGEYASEELKNNDGIVLAAISKYAGALQYSEELKKDRIISSSYIYSFIILLASRLSR